MAGLGILGVVSIIKIVKCDPTMKVLNRDLHGKVTFDYFNKSGIV